MTDHDSGRERRLETSTAAATTVAAAVMAVRHDSSRQWRTTRVPGVRSVRGTDCAPFASRGPLHGRLPAKPNPEPSAPTPPVDAEPPVNTTDRSNAWVHAICAAQRLLIATGEKRPFSLEAQ
jgi:hypothetical protein